jgi:hypothetical protein
VWWHILVILALRKASLGYMARQWRERERERENEPRVEA